jgi:hypothetical protein
LVSAKQAKHQVLQRSGYDRVGVLVGDVAGDEAQGGFADYRVHRGVY